MLRALLLTIICVCVYIPHTSVQDELKPTVKKSIPSRPDVSIRETGPIESLIHILTRQQYQYEVASYALKLNNVLPNFANFFHERSEEKYKTIKGLLRLCQVLNLNIQLPDISALRANQAIDLVGPKQLNGKNFIQFMKELDDNECLLTINELDKVYLINLASTEKMASIKMYLKKKMFNQQRLKCKITTDLHSRLKNFLPHANETSGVPFSLMFLDSHSAILKSS